MADASRAYEVVAFWYEPRSINWTTDYLKKLLIERHNIRAAIENPGGSIIIGGPAQAADADQLPSYSGMIGNPFHLDLIEAETEVRYLDKQDRIELLAWCDGLTPKQAAQFANLNGGRIRSSATQAARKRLQRTVAAVAEQVQNNEDPN
jgi:hypothetical protein